MIGKGDAMSPQEQLRYKEATEGLTIPSPVVASSATYRPDPSEVPSSDTVKMPNGKRISKEAFDKLQIKLKNRG